MRIQARGASRLAVGLISGCLLSCPLGALAAQFAPGALFLSKTPVTEGDTVLIHAVVQNDSASAFPGNVVFRDGDAPVGSVPVTLSPNEVRAVSVSWTPAAGSHKITASLEDKGGTVVQSEDQAFGVAQKPEPQATSSSAAAIESSDDIRQKIGDLSPAAGDATAPVFRLVDGARQAAADVLDDQLKKTEGKVTPVPGVVAGAETIHAPDQQGWMSSIVVTVYFYILTVLRFIVGSAGVFYPLVAFALLFFLWRMFRRFRRA